MNKNGFAPLIIILIIAILGVVGYFVYKNVQQASSSQSTSSQTVNTKQYLTKGAASIIDFPKLIFNYPLDWLVNEDANFDTSDDEIKISKGFYLVEISQVGIGGPGGCKFKDSPYIPASDDYSVDLTMVDYKEIDSNLGKLRYFLNPLNTDKTKNVYTFCEDYGR